MQAEQLQQAWRRASQSPDAPPQQGLDYGGGEGLHEGRAVSAFQRSPAWTNDTFGAFKPVRNWACTRDEALSHRCCVVRACEKPKLKCCQTCHLLSLQWSMATGNVSSW